MTAPQITLPPTPAPNKFGGDPVAFDTAMQARIDWHTTVTPEHNAMATWMNELGNELASSYQSAANITIAANTATSQAAAAVVAKDAAVAAWAASTSPAETLASISKSLHYGAVVKAIIYDTSKDSDGGGWRKRCADKSWYTESLGFTGTWGGQAASNAAGWAACGSVVGGAYQSTADGKFYTPTSSSTQTEIFRGNVREFPEQVAIVAETGRVVIYDLTQVGTPMWMAFTRGNNYFGLIWSTVVASSLAAKDGVIAIGMTQSAGVFIGNLTTDDGWFYASGTRARYKKWSSRNSTQTVVNSGAPYIVNPEVNDIAITVLDNAPIDAATGLPTPTIAVATAGGMSYIKDDGTVSNDASAGAVVSCSFADGFTNSANVRVVIGRGTASTNNLYLSVGFAAVSNFFSPTTSPAALAATTGDSATAIARKGVIASRCGAGLQIVKDNPATFASAMVAYVTKDYNTGWQVGAVKGAHLADTTAGTITASGELVTNGTFATDISSWVDATSTDATPSFSSNKLRLTRDTLNTASYVYQGITTVVGKTYVLTADIVSTAATYVRVSTTTAGTGDLAASGTIAAGTSSQTLTFVATGTTSYVSLWIYTGAATTTADFDNISCKLAEPDRSVKNKGLTLVGSLTKTAVASGAALVAYSGFSASNYLEQPYNSDLDFGTGDFSVMGWIKEAPNSAVEVVFSRGYYSGSWSGNGQFSISVLADGTLRSQISDDSYASADSIISTAAIDDSTWKFATLVRRSSYFELWINGVKAASDVAVSAAASSLSNTSAVTYLGRDVHTGSPLPLTNGSLALWRISATAPSADQIAHIYRTELPLFQAGAQCTIAGGYAGVTALSYDDIADTLHVGTTYGRSGFRDLLRIDSEATTVGAVTSLSANQGAVLTGGASSGRYYQPALLLRDELRRKEEARRALGKVPVFFDFDAVTSQVAFVLPKGYATKAVYSAGTLKRLGAAKDYTTNTDGFQETVTFAVAPGNTVWVSVMAVRS